MSSQYTEDFTTIDKEVSIEHSQNSTWFHRTFSTLHKDSERSAILMMIISSLGTGIFTLHTLFSKVGIVLAIIMIIIFGILYFLVTDILIQAHSKSEVSSSIADLVSINLGRKPRMAYDILLFTFLVLVMIATVKSISATFYSNFQEQIWRILNVTDISQQEFSNFNFYFCYIVGFFLFFINNKKSFEDLRKFSTISLIIFVYIILLSIIQSPLYHAEIKSRQQDIYNYFNFTIKDIVQKSGLLLFSFNCIINFFGVVTTVANPTTRRLRKIYKRTFGFLIILFIVFGLAIYYSLGDVYADKFDLFIFRDAIGSSDYLMQAGRCLLILSLWVSSGLLMYPLKQMIYASLNIEHSDKINMLISIVFTIIPVVFASLPIKISTMISLAGFINVTFTVFIFTGFIALNSGYANSSLKKYLIITWITIMTLISFSGTILAF
jgi:amino acid permease